MRKSMVFVYDIPPIPYPESKYKISFIWRS